MGAFVVARDAMTKAKTAAAQMVPVENQDGVEVSDEEELKDVPMVAAERIAAGLTNLTKPMSALHSQAEELVQEEQRTKRPRVKKWQRWPGNGQTAIRADSPQPSFGPPGGQ